MAADTGDSENASLSKGEKALARQLRDRITESLLPGEEAPPAERLTEAAEFLFETARRRASGEPAIRIGTARNGRRCMRVAVVNDDMPFLVDSVAAAVAAEGLAIDLLVHPIVTVRRDFSASSSIAAAKAGRSGASCLNSGCSDSDITP